MNAVDYEDIGHRIKTTRKKQNISQERLAELADISVSHMSHIETGQTKLGLPAMVRIANGLSISVDELLCGSLMQGKAVMQGEFSNLLADCTTEEAKVILDTSRALKKSLRGK